MKETVKDYIIFSFYNEQQFAKPLKIYLYNISGQLCYSQEFYCNENENFYEIILPDNMKPGLYFFKSMLCEDFFYTSQI